MGTEPRGRPSAETGKVSGVWKPDRGFGFPTREKEQPKGRVSERCEGRATEGSVSESRGLGGLSGDACDRPVGATVLTG